MFQYFSLFSQVITALLCVFFYKKFKDNQFYIFFLLLIVLISIVEGIGTYLIYTNVDSYLISYFFVLIQNVLSVMMFRLLLKKRKPLYYLFFIFFIFWIVFFNDRENTHKVVILGSINMATFSLMYLRELLVSDKIFVYKKTLPFWVSVAFLIFYLSSVPFFSMLNFMHTRGLFFVLYILIILMNLFIIYGLLCSKKEEEY